MAKLIRINPNESRDVLHDVPGIGVSARIKHTEPDKAQEFFAVRLLKPNAEGDGAGAETEYYVELGRDEAKLVMRDLARFLGPTLTAEEQRRRALGLRRPC